MKPGIYLNAEEILKQKTSILPIKLILEKIQSPSIKEFTKEGLEKAPDEFWTSPSSIRAKKFGIENRKYHTAFDLIEPGGIINHIIVCAYYVIEGLRRYIQLRKKLDKPPFIVPEPIWLDRALSAALLHDICIRGDNRKIKWGDKSCYNHGELAANLLSQLPSCKKLAKEDKFQILNGIKWHMGTFGPFPGRAFTPFEKVIQEADYYSTRTFLTGVDIQLLNYPPKDP